MTDLVLTLIGSDRPGLVEAVALIVAEHGGNWLESRMTHLAGKFAGILRAELPPDHVAEAVKALAALEARGLKVVVEAVPRAERAPLQRTMDLELLGPSESLFALSNGHLGLRGNLDEGEPHARVVRAHVRGAN